MSLIYAGFLTVTQDDLHAASLSLNSSKACRGLAGELFYALLISTSIVNLIKLTGNFDKGTQNVRVEMPGHGPTIAFRDYSCGCRMVNDGLT